MQTLVNQSARNGGNAYAGFIARSMDHPWNSEYLYQKLATPLLQGHTYYVEFWVSLKDDSRYAVSTIGAYFGASEAQITAGDGQLGAGLHNNEVIPQIRSTNGYITNKTGWTKISGYFSPSTNVSFMAIGNFDPTFGPTSSNHTVLSNGCTTSGTDCYYSAYYFLDDILVKEACPTIPAPTGVLVSNNHYGLDVAVPAIAANSGDSFNWYINGVMVEGQHDNFMEMRFEEHPEWKLCGREVVIQVSRVVNGCESQKWIDQYFEITCSSTEKLALTMEAYPNPATEELTLELSGEHEADVNLYDNYGQLKKSLKVKKGKTKIKMNDLSKGIYTLHVNDGKNVYKKQIIIER